MIGPEPLTLAHSNAKPLEGADMTFKLGDQIRLVPIDEDLVVRSFHEGHTAMEISKLIGCGITPVRRVLNKFALKRTAAPRKGLFSGSGNPAWNGGRSVRKDGYVLVYVPGKRRKQLEHRVLKEQAMGRPLLPTEVVHHDDENKSRNVDGNLILLPSQSEHSRIHAKRGPSGGPWCKCGPCPLCYEEFTGRGKQKVCPDCRSTEQYQIWQKEQHRKAMMAYEERLRASKCS